jgi:hypothetical protein
MEQSFSFCRTRNGNHINLRRSSDGAASPCGRKQRHESVSTQQIPVLLFFLVEVQAKRWEARTRITLQA